MKSLAEAENEVMWRYCLKITEKKNDVKRSATLKSVQVRRKSRDNEKQRTHLTFK